MTLWTSDQAAKATGGERRGDWQATGVSIDTRNLRRGDLFIALKDIRDGHDFVAQAFEEGAAAAMVSRVPEGVSASADLLIVPDVLRGLEDLGRAGRARAGAKVVGITGSVGKTSTKEMLRDVLGGQGQVHAAEASYNNHWGVPLTLARLPMEADFAVIEIGMSNPGEIAPLAKMAELHVAIITTIAPAHLEALGSLEAIAVEKASIFKGLATDGTAIVDGDVTTTGILQQAARAKGVRLVTFGSSEGCDLQLKDVRLHDQITVGQARLPQHRQVLFKVGSGGRHFAHNALAVIAATEALGLDLDVAIADLGRWQPPSGRGTREVLLLDSVDEALSIELIDDAFNANPTSMQAALEVLAAAQTREDVGRIAAGRRIAILGDMLELGPDEIEMHRALADLPEMAELACVHCVGTRMRALWHDLPGPIKGHWFENAEDMAAEAYRLIDAGDVVLVKGSKGSRVSLVVEALRRAAHEASANGSLQAVSGHIRAEGDG
ncbi:MAG: UDP-N-acetylmuramoyl-tripeptide--D-alanyl-D-alanine ligase [Pseudomonadota bacterium]